MNPNTEFFKGGLLIAVGGLMICTLILIPFGIPVIIHGLRFCKRALKQEKEMKAAIWRQRMVDQHGPAFG